MPPVFDILNYSEKALLHQEKNKKDQEKRDTDRNTMGKHSNLGPIYPQIGGMPANEFVDLLKNAMIDLQTNKNIQYWQLTLSKYGAINN